MISVAHGLVGATFAVLLRRALTQVWVDELSADDAVRDVIRWGMPALSGAASALAVAAGIFTARPRRFFLRDALSWAALLVIVFALARGRLDRDYIGVLYVLAVIVRFAPAAIASATAERAWPLLFATAFGVYASLAAWHQAAALPLGDQVHYLLTADRLAHGSVDASFDAALFRRLTTLTPGDLDIATHVLDTPLGPRSIQGYGLPLLLLPGWLAGGRLGAELVVAFAAAGASVLTALILRDTIAPVRLRAAVWAMASFLAPAVLLAFHVYPNAFGAAAIAAAYRFGVTASVRRPALAGAAAGLTLFLNPRDGLVLAVLLVAMWWVGRHDFVRFALGAGAVVVVAVASNALLYGLPLPYAGYLVGVARAQELVHEPTLSFQFWIGLPAMLFDRTFGVAGVAPWLFIAAAGIAAALRTDRRRLAPAAAAIGLGLIALSIYRYWEGGYAPAARYFVDVLPLVAPFVAYGLAAMRDLWARAFAGLLVGVSAVATLVLCAMPSRAANDAFQQQLQDVLNGSLGVNPIGWLPSFVPTTPDWYIGAYLRLVPALVIVGGLAVYGWRRGASADQPALPRTARSVMLGFVAANAVALAVTVVAVSQPWTHGLGEPQRSLAAYWLPIALAIAAGLSTVVAIHVDPAARPGFFARHFALYLAVPLTLLGLQSSFIPLEALGVAYIGVAVALAANALHAIWRALNRLSDTRIAALVGATMLAAALVVLLYDMAAVPLASDEPHYLIVTQSIVLDRDLDLANDYDDDRYFSFYPARLPDVHGIHVGERIYTLRDLGLPLLAVIPFALLERAGALILTCLFGALLAAQLYLLLRDLAFDRRVAFGAVAATAFVHPLLTYTTQVYPDLIAALMFVSAVRLLRRGANASLRELALASAFTGTLPWLSTRAWFVAIGLGLVIAYVALRPRRELVRRALAAALPFAALVLALAYVNWRMFGLFLPSAGYFLVRGQTEIATFAPHVGLLGLLFDRAFGLVPRAAIYLLAFLGAGALWRRRRSGGPELAALFLGWLLYLAFIANVTYWFADGAPPSRYLLAGLPFLVVAVAAGIETALGASGRLRAALVGLTWVLGGWSIFITFVYAVMPKLRSEFASQIRDSGQVQLWLDVGRIVRPNPEVLMPSFIAADAATAPLALFWVAVAAALITLPLVSRASDALHDARRVRAAP
ncbi:MAG TPA: hypothetical protein VGR87_15835 [Candidatus Limnocylindria bacterium]|nr:hypothetical protein [Candidatus Limnocylindria bacterium]